jgi:hypothetical protein
MNRLMGFEEVWAFDKRMRRFEAPSRPDLAAQQARAVNVFRGARDDEVSSRAGK